MLIMNVLGTIIALRLVWMLFVYNSLMRKHDFDFRFSNRFVEIREHLIFFRWDIWLPKQVEKYMGIR